MNYLLVVLIKEERDDEGKLLTTVPSPLKASSNGMAGNPVDLGNKTFASITLHRGMDEAKMAELLARVRETAGFISVRYMNI